MLDLNHLASNPNVDVQVFMGTVSTGSGRTWVRPRGTTMMYILCVGAGGNGGNGAVGSPASGGGGGASGNQVTLIAPSLLLPSQLDVYSGGPGSASVVRLQGMSTPNNILVQANQGGNGGNASAGTAGAAGTAGGSNALSGACLAGLGFWSYVGGMGGTIGGTSTGNGGNMAPPTTGLVVTGGTGGGGMGSTARAGGSINLSIGMYPAIPGGEAAPNTTTPPGRGCNGHAPVPGLLHLTGGTGGGGTLSTATGAGLVGARGGDGAPGCGGGGGGGALTGSTQGLGGLGGPGFVIIIAW